MKSGVEKRNREECKRTRLVFEFSFDDRVISSSLEEIRGAGRSITLRFYRREAVEVFVRETEYGMTRRFGAVLHPVLIQAT